MKRRKKYNVKLSKQGKLLGGIYQHKRFQTQIRAISVANNLYHFFVLYGFDEINPLKREKKRKWYTGKNFVCYFNKKKLWRCKIYYLSSMMGTEAACLFKSCSLWYGRKRKEKKSVRRGKQLRCKLCLIIRYLRPAAETNKSCLEQTFSLKSRATRLYKS